MIMWCSHADHASVQRQECLASHLHIYMTYQVFDYTIGREIKLSKKWITPVHSGGHGEILTTRSVVAIYERPTTIQTVDCDRYHVLTECTTLVLKSPWWWRYKRFCLPVGRHCSSALTDLRFTVDIATALTKDPQKILIDHTVNVVITVVHWWLCSETHAVSAVGLAIASLLVIDWAWSSCDMR